jgi:PAS domain S-box-containing protein
MSRLAAGGSVFAVAVGVSALGGWWTHHLAILTTWGVAPVKMVANTAACFVLTGLSLWLLRKKNEHPFGRAGRAIAQASAALASMVGLLSLAEHFFALNLGIDQWLTVLPPAEVGVGLRPGLMSSITAFDFVILGVALLGLDWRTRRKDWPAQFLSLAVTVGAMFGVLAVLLEPHAFPTSMSVPTAVTFIVLACGLVCSRATWAVGGLLARQSPGARLLRRAVPAGLLVLSVVGWLISSALLTDVHFTWVEVSVLAIVCSGLLAGFIAWVAFQVDRSDAERQKAVDALRGSPEQAEQLLGRIEQPESERKLRRRVEAGFGAAILLTGLLGLLSWRIAKQTAEDADWVAHTHEVSTRLEVTLRHLVDVETGARGFALTGEESFLEPYEAGRMAFAHDLEALQALIVDPDQKRRLAALRQQAQSELEAVNDMVNGRKITGRAPIIPFLELGKELMDEARVTVGEMEEGQARLLEKRTRRSRAAQRFSSAATALASIFGVIFLSVAGFTVSREVGLSARARAQVVALNADLERRVAERTAALRESEGRLAGVIQSAMDAIVTVDEQQKIVMFNAAAEKMFGCPAAAARGQAVTRFIPQRFRAAHAEHIREFGETGVTSRAMGTKRVLWAMRADGTEFRIEASISQLSAGGRKLFTVIMRDVTERVRAEELREHLAAVVESSDDAIISKDLNGVINGWNRGAENIFGYGAREMVGKPMLMLFPRDRLAEEADILGRIGRGESVEHYETVRVRKDGTKIDVSVTISPIRDGTGAIVGASKIARDITQRKRAEEDLRESEERFRLFVEHAPAALAMFDREMRYLHWSERWRTDYGLEERDLYGVSHYELFPELPQVWKEIHRRGLAGEVLRAEQDRFERPDGSVQWLRWEVRPWYDRKGEVAGIVIFAEDITEGKLAEDARRESETNFAGLVNLVPQIVWICTNEGLNIFFNERWFRYTGLTAEQSRGTGWATPFHPDDQQKAWDTWNQATATGSTYMVESRLRAADGSYRWFLMLGEPLRDADGGVVKWFGTCTDIDDIKSAQAALRESEERFLAMANGIPQLAWMADADGQIFWYNQRWYDCTGTTLEEMAGWGWQKVHDPAALAKVLERWKGSIASGDPFDMEFPLRGADGVYRMFLNRVMPVKDAEGKVTRWFGTNTDISERKRAEEQLATQAEELSQQATELSRSRVLLEAQKLILKSVLDSMEEGLVAADERGKFIIWNPAAEKIMRLGAEEMSPEQWSAHYGLYEADGVTLLAPEKNPLLGAIQGKSSTTEMFMRNLRLGEGIWVEANASPLKDEEGMVHGGVVAFRDITERKRVEAELVRQAEELQVSSQALEEQKLMLQSVLDSMAEGLVAADEHGKFILWNPAATKIVGMGAENVPPGEWNSHYGCYLPDTVTPLPAQENPLLRAVRGETCTTEMFVRNQELEQGAWLEVSGGPLKDRNGALRGGVVAFRDITSRKEAERKIRQFNQELEERVVERTAQLAEANEELEAFTYSVSHDLRAPLRHMSGFTKILAEDFGPSLPPEAQEHVERIQRGAHKMGQLVDELLNLTRVGRQALAVQVVDLNGVVKEVVNMLQPEAEGREVEWKIEELPAMACDAVLVRQVFQNLIGNALKYSRPRSPAVIEIGHGKIDGQETVFVKDNGVGFDMKYADKVFGVFQRLHRSEDFEGTGVGLATVHRIVQKHGGRIWAEAAVGRGATFYFTLGSRGALETKETAASAGGSV